MSKSYIRLFLMLCIAALWAGCREDVSPLPDESAREGGVAVEFTVDIDGCADTRGVVSESKTEFDKGELIHIRAEFYCQPKEGGQPRRDVIYTILQCDYSTYSGKRYNIQWKTLSGQPTLMWPDDAVTGKFTAYYIAGSSGALSDNPMERKLLSDYRAAEVPLSAEVEDVRYGVCVILHMKRLFSFLTLTEIQEGISDDFWFTVHDDKFNNAFRLLFNPETKEMKPEFSRIPSDDYKYENGEQLVVVKSYKGGATEDGADDGSTAGTSFFLEPRVYRQFSILFPRSRSDFASYVTYTKDLSELLAGDDNPSGAFLPNGRYVFSILKSVGVIVEESPDDGWDEEEPMVDIDVEQFLRAVQLGDNYSEYDENTQQDVQILESTTDGTRLLRNVSFHREYYDVFAPDNFRPTLSNTFDGNYHYIHDMACPLFYENYGNIINLGIRDAVTRDAEGNLRPLISCLRVERFGNTFDMRYNGIIASRNMGVVDNVRVENVDMTVHILAEDTGEAHNVSLLFGVNQGRVYDVGLAGTLRLTVGNADGASVMPQVSTGGVAGQNTGAVSGVTYFDEENMPEIVIVNNCQGDHGAYWTGGAAGNNTGTLADIFLPSVSGDASGSPGVGSCVGGLVGESPSSTSDAPEVTGCIVRGSVKAGPIKPQTNLRAYSYTGGVAGAWNLQGSIENCSVSVGVTDATTADSAAEYGQGGAFGIIQPIPSGSGLQEGSIRILSCYGSTLTGNGYVGNFAGIVPENYGWEHYKDNQINVKQYDGTKNVGLEKAN